MSEEAHPKKRGVVPGDNEDDGGPGELGIGEIRLHRVQGVRVGLQLTAFRA